METIYRVNMTEGTVRAEAIAGDYAGLGGRGLTSTVIQKEVHPLCHALSGENKLVLAPGLLSGTTAPCSGRLSVGTKSPLTGGIKEANAGGTGAQKLARLGVAAIIVEGQRRGGGLFVLKVTADGAELMPAEGLEGLGNYDTVARLTAAHGEKASYITIGQAGEMKMTAASIGVTDMENRPTRHAGRGGVGAVMGAKGLKAIVVDDAGAKRPAMQDSEAFQAAARKFARLLSEHAVTGQTLPTYGTNALANVINEAGAYPTRNFSAGQFEGVERISGERQREVILERGGLAKHPCHPGCTITCSRVYMDADGNYLTKGPEYETIWASGANCGIDDLDAIAKLDRLYDDYGLDTIEMGVALGVAMEGGAIEFGDAQGAVRLIEEVGAGTAMGRILGSGAAVTGQAFGVSRVPVVKGQGLPAYDPRAAKGIGVTYATTPMGADHTAGYAIAPNILKVGGDVDPLSPEGQAEMSRQLQIATAALDSTGLCLFVAFCVLDEPEAMQAIVDMLNAEYSTALTADDVTALGQRILKVERAFNAAAGFTATDDRLPRFFQTEPLPPHNVVFDVPDADLDSVHNF
ncbi:MAG: aldehyde ferredoxin oxidoreductase [Candidatus Handelsmanbacteria bacterium RIFCSPLOWO2_12_FULL_64_10]|uniref:Aldehyde ferredoxin oxidoreductase n=1 Tax=Handelsmanbacteria sp. (strain RIFCSPLOWO2_12_FULL_64_10) TaxID=1817868 RepID=A0A1F6CM84_HANXR|nr:MAG: aldehyde ferredoxin oxidoreductase [Candidatus Handelsmanbacteria bacterium RIFCSPLOWO2_12_FULL_64_10]